MLDIPTGESARQAWLALPAQTRFEVGLLAKQGRPYPDPEVARVVVGHQRAVQARRWPRAAAGFLLIVPFVVTGLSVPVLGIWSFLGTVALLGALVAVTWLLPGLPAGTEAVHLNSLLARLETPKPEPRIFRAAPADRVALAVTIAAIATGIAITLVIPALGPEVALATIRRNWHFVALLVLFAIGRNLYRYRRPLAPAPPVRLGPEGARFRRYGLVPWSEVLQVSVDGETCDVAWELTRKRRFVIDRSSLADAPEELYLAALAYLRQVRAAPLSPAR